MALTYYEADLRTEPLTATFPSAGAAIDAQMHVLLHEAREAMANERAAPTDSHMTPFDIDTEMPGVLVGTEEASFASTEVRRMNYQRAKERLGKSSVSPPDAASADAVFSVAAEAAEKEAAKVQKRSLKAAQTKAANENAKAAQREQRKAETPEEKRERIAEEKRQRAERAEKRQAEGGDEARRKAAKKPTSDAAPKKAATPTDLYGEPEDATLRSAMSQHYGQSATRRKAGKRPDGTPRKFFESPLPFHRHLYGLTRCSVPASLEPTLLRAEASDAVEVIVGPPGTGKTHELVRRIAEYRRGGKGSVFACAPTNVGAANLYRQLVAHGLGDDVALVVPAERVPAGTVVLSNDPSRPIVCATVSARSGPLDGRDFHALFVDEACMLIEAWAWTLLRGTVEKVVLAGDPRQLPAVTSQSGARLGHERSLMERLLDSGYPHTALHAQHRMAPPIHEFVNANFYDGVLTIGGHAPSDGSFEVRFVASASERAVGTSYRNDVEVDAISEFLGTCSEEERAGAVVVCPYVAQCQTVLARKLDVDVHTVDSFQGREAATVILTTVRDGTSGSGFWEDRRRMVVALTRARHRLVVFTSFRQTRPSDAGSPLSRLASRAVPRAADGVAPTRVRSARGK